MKHFAKFAFAAAAAFLFTATTATAGEPTCNARFVAHKHNLYGNTFFSVDVYYKTPGMQRERFVITQYMSEQDVDGFAVKTASEVLCPIANNRAAMNDPCASTDWVIEEDLFGWGNEECSTYRHRP